VKIRVFSSADAAARALARYVGAAIARNPRLVLGLPTGRTPIPFYHELAARAAAHTIDFSHVTTFNLDEFFGLGRNDPASYCAFMQAHLFSRVNLSPRRIHFLNGRARNAAAECGRYESAIRRAGGIDLQILGLGANGHIGFNGPAAGRSHASDAAHTRHARGECSAVWRRSAEGAARGAFDGDGHHPRSASHRVARDRPREGAMCGPNGGRAAHDRSPGVLLTGAPRRRRAARPRGGASSAAA
jgi:6-phosphogluconolactonase/glucosamine-6-phosphate isomerase/deaminase